MNTDIRFEYPSNRYFDIVKTKEQYDAFIGSGMAWELEPHCPHSWIEHLRLIKKRRINV